jgi:hypothetical protein
MYAVYMLVCWKDFCFIVYVVRTAGRSEYIPTVRRVGRLELGYALVAEVDGRLGLKRGMPKRQIGERWTSRNGSSLNAL